MKRDVMNVIPALAVGLMVIVAVATGLSRYAAGTPAEREGQSSRATAPRGLPGWLGLGEGGCCGASGTGGGEDLEAEALRLYRHSGGDGDNVVAQLRDFGCHVEVAVFRDGKMVRRYRVAGAGRLVEVR